MAFNKLATVLLVICILCCSYSSSAATIDAFDVDSNSIISFSGAVEISGESFVQDASDGLLNEFPPKITVVILNPGYNEEDLNNIELLNIPKIVNHLSVITAESDGTYTFSSKIRGKTGEYTILLSSRYLEQPIIRKFDYIDTITAEFNEAKNNVDVNILKLFVEEENNALGLDMYGYIQLKNIGKENIVIEKLKEEDDFEDVQQIIEAFDDIINSTMFIVIEDAEELYQYVAREFADYPIIGFLAENVSEELRNAVMSDFVGESIGSIDTFIKQVTDKTLMCYLENSNYWKSFETVLNEEIFAFSKQSLNVYNNLENPNAVLKDLYEKFSTCQSPEQVRTTFSALVDYWYKIENKNDSDTPQAPGGSSGGSSGGGMMITKPPLNVDDNEGKLTDVVEAKPNGDNEIQKSACFVDVKDTHWANTAITALFDAKIINGVAEDVFLPDGIITREQFVQMCMKGLRLTGVGQTVDFSDVNKNAWYYASVAAAYNNNIIKGISETSFGVGEEITREDATVLLFRCAQKMNIILPTSNGLRFIDENKISDYATNAVNSLSSAGIVTGMEDNSFMPQKSLTRAEGAKLIYEFLKYGKLI